GNRLFMSTSTDGGLTWSAPVSTAGNADGLGGEPLVQPNGTVVVPYLANAPFIESFSSSDGGVSWSAAVVVAHVYDHLVAGALCLWDSSLPSMAEQRGVRPRHLPGRCR